MISSNTVKHRKDKIIISTNTLRENNPSNECARATNATIRCTSGDQSRLSKLDGHTKSPQLHRGRVLFRGQQHTVGLRRRDKQKARLAD